METNRRNIMILFFTLVVVMMGFGMAIPVLPFYIEEFGASGSSMGLLMAIYALMQFIFAPLWGDLSDRYGRKPILVMGILGNAIAQVLFGMATSMSMLFIARALAGILSSATMPTAMAYISDSTTEEDRGKGMGILGAAMGVGMILGPGLAGFMAKVSLGLPFFVAAAASMVALVMVVLWLPESLSAEERATHAGSSGPQFRLGNLFRDMWAALFSPIGVLLAVAFLLSFGLTNFEAIFGLYALDRYEYDSVQVGMILMFMGVISAVVQGMLTGPAIKRWGEVNVLRLAMLISAVGFVLMIIPDALIGILLTVAIFITGNSLLRPVTSALISRRATGGQGVAMGLNNSFMSLGRIIGPTWAGFVYDSNINLPYVSGAIIMFVGLAVCIFWIRRQETVGQEVGEVEAQPAR
ncbi:MFS transporter [Chloroflexota bacterium]